MGCANRTVGDPQFTGNSSITSWKTQVNHEIDIEIPANCMSKCASTCGVVVQCWCSAGVGLHCVLAAVRPCHVPCTDSTVCAETGVSATMNFTQLKGTGCVGRYNTANLNNYIFATNGGTGPAYSNMCVGVFDKPVAAADKGGDSSSGSDSNEGRSNTGMLLHPKNPPGCTPRRLVGSLTSSL
jgi:hypothetical protein